MKHPLFVGHFDTTVRSYKPKVTKPITLASARTILAHYCDKTADGAPLLADSDESVISEGGWLGRIGREDVHFKAGYLICPWLSGGINNGSLKFIRELQASLGVQIYEPGDARFMSVEALEEAEREFSQSN
jgi:hypothetical protein